MKPIRTAIVISVLFLLSACASNGNTATSQAAMNAKCPMSGEQIDASSPTTTFDGKSIGFCCDKCIAKFEKLTPAQQQAKVDSAMSAK
jgi:hypothetical protein